MRKINIKDIQLDIDIVQLFNIKSTQSTVLIDIDGNIYNSKDETIKKAIIFENYNLESLSTINDLKEFTTKLFKGYKPTITGVNCKIKPLSNWQNIIGMNQNTMIYYDHQSDGVELFEDKTLEDFGWQASALEINYRAISDFIEENCEGTLLFYDNEIQFSGFAIVNNIEDVRNLVKSFIITKAKENISNNVCELDDDDVIEALEFFKIEV